MMRLQLLTLLLLGMGGLVAFVTAIYKDTYVVKGAMSNAKGEIVLTGMATLDLPLIVAPVLPLKELFSVETIHVTLPGSTTGPAELISGEAINEAGPSVVTSIRMFRISGVEKVNSTAVVFHALGGEQIRVWNGVTTVRLSATGPEIPVCSANVTCAAFQVEGAELAEKYLAQAEALLVPFEEGRRRLAEACLDPYTSVGRDAAQTAATDRCQPNGLTWGPGDLVVTLAACWNLALKNGLNWGPGDWDPWVGPQDLGTRGLGSYSGCYAYADTGNAFFGNFGTETQMLQVISNYREWNRQPLRISSLDTNCLLLSNQAKLEAKLEILQRLATSTLEFSPPTYTLMSGISWYDGPLGLSWDGANAACLAAGLQLATVQSAAQNALLLTAADGNRVWIGGTDAASEGAWVWSPSNVLGVEPTFDIHGYAVDRGSTGTPLGPYENWYPGEPNDAFSSEDCLMVNLDGMWNDDRCTTRKKYVCQQTN